MRLDLRIKKKATDLRISGYGINEISRRLKIGSNTVSRWCRGINLTSRQQKVLHQRVDKFGRQQHRRAMELRIEQNRLRNKKIEEVASEEIGKLNRREQFLVGVTLYWAEGFKHKMEKALGLANSDPLLVKFYIDWLIRGLMVKRSDLSLRITTNISLKSRINKYRKFWADFLGIPYTQFGKPFFQQTKQKRVYPKDRRYYGVIRVRVRKSSLFFKKMGGWIRGLSLAKSS